MKQILFIMGTVFLLAPVVVFGQYYVIGDIPDTGDDGMVPVEEITITEQGPSQQTIEDTVEDVNIVNTQTKTTTFETTKTTTQQKKDTLTIAGITGTVAGAVLALSSSAIPLFATTPTMMQDLLFLNLFGFLSKKRNERRWGVVFDADTKLPIPAAKIVLFDMQGKELETTYSDKDGRFGFLAGEGKYRIEAYKKNYQLFTQKNADEIYGAIYNGDIIEATGDNVLSINIALQNPNINWQEYADKKVKTYTGTWSLVKKYLFTSLYVIGFIATIIITIFFPSIINIILVVINVVFFMFIFLFKRKDHGTVVKADKTPVPFAVVNLYDENGVKDKFAVTDVIGRYYMLSDNGKYIIKAKAQGGDATSVVQDEVHVRDGLVNKDIVMK